jgi:hypothetical protein
LVTPRWLLAPLPILALSLVARPAVAEVSIHAQVDATKVGVDDQVQLTISVEGGFDGDVPLPPLQNLKRVGGPFVSSQVSIVNGAVSQARSFTFVLQPSAVGRAEIGSARIVVGGAEKKTDPIAVEVVPGALRQSQSPSNPFDDAFGEDPFASFFGSRRRAEPKLQAVAVASRQRVHVGEALTLTYYLYTQTSVTGVELAQAPQYPGFWAEDVAQPKGPSRGEHVDLDGVTYARFPILQKLLFPTKAGKLTIPAATFRFGLGRASVFDPGGTAERSTRPVAVVVEALPAEPGFSGAVGEFAVHASFDRDTVPLGEAATLRFTVQGEGNLKWIDRAPEVSIPGAKTYPPQTKSDLQVGPGGMKGSKTWDFVVVPETSGTLEVPSLPFAYYDPAAGVMKKANTRTLALQVVGGAGNAAAAAPSTPVATAPVSRLALRSDLDLPSHVLPEVGPRALVLGLGLALVLHASVAAWSFLSDRRRLTGGRTTARHRVRQALSELEKAGRGKLSKEQSAAAIERTLHEVFGPLGENGGSPRGPREEAIGNVLQEVQFIRYAPQLGDYTEKIGEVARRAADVVRRWA